MSSSQTVKSSNEAKKKRGKRLLFFLLNFGTFLPAGQEEKVDEMMDWMRLKCGFNLFI